jgi:hypothetical protein
MELIYLNEIQRIDDLFPESTWGKGFPKTPNRRKGKSTRTLEQNILSAMQILMNSMSRKKMQ